MFSIRSKSFYLLNKKLYTANSAGKTTSHLIKTKGKASPPPLPTRGKASKGKASPPPLSAKGKAPSSFRAPSRQEKELIWTQPFVLRNYNLKNSFAYAEWVNFKNIKHFKWLLQRFQSHRHFFSENQYPTFPIMAFYFFAGGGAALFICRPEGPAI